MKYIYFIERNGIKYYKLDTFWSESKDISRAKIYSSLDNSLITSYLHSMDSWFDSNPKKFLEHYKDFNGGSLGYQTVEDDQIHPDNEYILIDNPAPKGTVYVFTMNVYEDGTNELTDYKKVNRENKIRIILDSDTNG